MKRNWWLLKKTSRDVFKRITKRIQSFFFRPTVEKLKNIEYQKLPSPVNWSAIAQGRSLQVEIGSGHGEVLLANDSARSVTVGYEIKARFYLLTKRKIRKRSDVFVYKGSGYESLDLHYAPDSISRIVILFPDPWHKKKHAKRRPITKEFFEKVYPYLKSNGEILIATDWDDYSSFIASQASEVTTKYSVENGVYEAPNFGLPITHFHQKWIRKGRSFQYFLLKKRT
ncbi:MAG: tRNA (guanine(46)-N(7))-methyltransferase TrmB [Patescibacteria group bacterium]